MKAAWWTILLGSIIGFGFGLSYAWIIAPVRYVDTLPSTLRADFKDQYRLTVAAAYAGTHNLARSRARLALLGDQDPVQALTALAQRMLANGETFETVQQVAQLATDLNSGVVALLPSPTATVASPASSGPSGDTPTPPPSLTGTPGAPTSSDTPEATLTAAVFDTFTPRPTRTPNPTAGAPYQLASQETVCQPDLTNGLLQVTVMDSRHHHVPGAEVIITWNGGEEHIFTGFKPEIANGYADFIMRPDVSYTVRVADSGMPAANLISPACADANGQSYQGGIHLTFQQP